MCFSSFSFKTSMAKRKCISQESASLFRKATRGDSGFGFGVCRKVEMTHPPKYPWGSLVFLLIKTLMSIKAMQRVSCKGKADGG